MPKKSKIIDERDRKILRELEKDARQTDSSIAKKIRLSKQVVNYRVQKMIESKVISNFYTVVNVGNLGLNTYYVFLQLEKINKEEEKALLQELNSLDNIIAIRILKKIETLRTNPDLDIRPLKGYNAYRLRAGDYRIIFTMNYEKKVITINNVGHRKNVYD